MSASALARPRVEPALAGVLLFIASESVVFLTFIVSFVAYHGSGSDELRPHLDVGLTAVFSLLLFASSFTVSRVRGTASRADLAWLALTWVLGAAFLAGQGREYAKLLGEGVTPATRPFVTAFFGLTGLHGAHVLAGLGAIAALWVASALRPSRVGGVAFEAVAVYWHFVDAVWVVVFSLAYLWSLL